MKDICALCGEEIQEVRDTIWYVDEKDKNLKTRHKKSCQEELKFKSPDFYMKRVGQLKHD